MFHSISVTLWECSFLRLSKEALLILPFGRVSVSLDLGILVKVVEGLESRSHKVP